MSPILKRDIGETLRQARRLATVATGHYPEENEHDGPSHYDYLKQNEEINASGKGKWKRVEEVDLTGSFGSGADKRQGIGVENGDVGWVDHTSSHQSSQDAQEARDAQDPFGASSSGSSGSSRGEGTVRGGYAQPHSQFKGQHGSDSRQGEEIWSNDYNYIDNEDEDEGKLKVRDSAEKERMLTNKEKYRGPDADVYDDESEGVFVDEDEVDRLRRSRIGGLAGMGYEEGDQPGVKRKGQLRDLRNLLMESTPSLLLSLVGLVFTGELLEHLARWRVFRRVDELFILVPMIGNLKGNLEMCLSARLGTSANIGELDHRHTRRALLIGNMTLLGLQALLISCLAAFLSFALGLFTIHRLGDTPDSTGIGDSNGTTGVGGGDPGLAVGEQEWHEGYTRPGWKQLVMVLATGMGSAGISSAVLGSFMSSLIVLSRWFNIDPDNITPPLAACLGDLLTLFILALLGTALVGAMDTPFPLICVILMSIAAGWFTKRVMRNQWVKKVAKGGWTPLIGAMLISSGTGMALEKGVGKYRGFALLAISMTGLTGAIGGIYASRLSTQLHATLHSPRQGQNKSGGLSLVHSALALYVLAFPCQGCFVMFVRWAGWIDLDLSWAGWLCFALTSAISLLLAHHLTIFFWSKDLDPDSYTLPLQSALVDFLGQLLLMIAYEVCILQGLDVLVHEAVPPL